MHTIVVIPTYNEIENAPKIIPAVLAVDPEIDVLIVDDSSPDGTGEFVASLMRTEPRVHLLVNKEKKGLGPAYLKGFKEALTYHPKYVVEMDADFSHDPAELAKFLERIKDADVVIGSRYSNGISVIEWPLRRLLLSYFGNFYTRVVLGMKIKDATGGFKMFRADALARLNVDYVKSAGYSFQVEMNYAFEKNGFRLVESPIVFRDRHEGVSKMSGNIIVEAFFRVLRLRFRNKKKYFAPK